MKEIFLEAISRLMKDEKLIWRKQHRATNMFVFYDEMIGSVDDVIRAAYPDFSNAFHTAPANSKEGEKEPESLYTKSSDQQSRIKLAHGHRCFFGLSGWVRLDNL